MTKAKTVSAYIAAAPARLRAKLKQLRAIIKKTAPSAEEKLSYGMPYCGYQGRLAYFAYAKDHIGLYIMPPVLAKHKKEVQAYKTGKATLRLEPEAKLPVGLIQKLLRTGIKQNEQKAQAKSSAGKLTICSRGHKFYKSSQRPVCPLCWPGRYKK